MSMTVLKVSILSVNIQWPQSFGRLNQFIAGEIPAYKTKEIMPQKQEITPEQTEVLQLMNKEGLLTEKPAEKKKVVKLFPREFFSNCKYRFSLAQPPKAWVNPKKNKSARRKRPAEKLGEYVQKWATDNKYAR
jgi:hypothetical protein